MVKYIYFIKQEKDHFFYNYFFLTPEPTKIMYLYACFNLHLKIIVLNIA